MPILEQKISSANVVQFNDGDGSPKVVAVKMVIFALIGLFLAVANFFAENIFIKASTPKSIQEKIVFQGSDVWTPGGGILRLYSEDAKLALEQDEYLSSVFKFESGRLWGNFMQDDLFTTSIYADRITILPLFATFDLQFDGAILKLAVYDGDVWLKFPTEPGGQDFLNSLYVPKDTQVTVSLNKLNEGIRSLFLSKLMKEFKYSVIPAADREVPWIVENLKRDNDFAQMKKQEFVAEILAGGVTDNDGIFARFSVWLRDNFTFIPGKRERLAGAQTFAYLNNALFFATQGNSTGSVESLNKFLEGYAVLFEADATGNRVVEYLRKLLVFSPDDSQYEVLRQMVKQYDIELVRDEVLWRSVNQGIRIGDAVAEKTLDDYYQSVLARTDLDADYMALQNQRFDNLLLKYPTFYRDAYFAMKGVLEERLLGAYEGGAMKNEVVQSLIGTKIDFLKRLRKFFFEGAIELAETKEIFSRLVNEINDLMPDNSAVAVVKLFESQLADADDFWGYLTSPEYQTKVYGLTHKDRYQAYLAERKKIASFLNIQEEVLGEKVEKKDVPDVVKEIEKVFAGHSDVRDLEIGKIESGDQRFVDVKAVIGGYPFKAAYDRATEAVKDINVFDQVVSDSAVKLDNLLVILNQRFADLAPDEGELVEEVTVESSAARLARAFVAKQLVKYGFVATMEDVKALDESGGVYRLEGLKFEGNPGAEATFDLVMSGEVATNILLYIDSRPVAVEGQYKLEELAALIVEGDFADAAGEGTGESGSEDANGSEASVF